MKATGFSLIEALVATAVVTAGVASLAQLCVASARAHGIANTTSVTVLLAAGQMEELLGEADLRPSPPGTLRANREGFVEYLDASGALLGVTAITPPPGTAYICRWSIEPLPDSAIGTLVLQVLAMPWSRDVSGGPGEARFVSVKTRKAS